MPGDSTGNVSVDVVTRKSRTSISPRTPDDLTSSQASSVWWVSLSQGIWRRVEFLLIPLNFLHNSLIGLSHNSAACQLQKRHF